VISLRVPTLVRALRPASQAARRTRVSAVGRLSTAADAILWTRRWTELRTPDRAAFSWGAAGGSAAARGAMPGARTNENRSGRAISSSTGVPAAITAVTSTEAVLADPTTQSKALTHEPIEPRAVTLPARPGGPSHFYPRGLWIVGARGSTGCG
jgi:hypothetical protein